MKVLRATRQGRDCFVLAEKTALGSRSRLGAHGIARKPAGPLSTPCGRTEVDTLLCPPRALPNQRKRPKAALWLVGRHVSSLGSSGNCRLAVTWTSLQGVMCVKFCKMAAIAVVMFLCSAETPFLRPGLTFAKRRAQRRSRLAEGHRQSAARSGLDGREHGAIVGQAGSVMPPAAASAFCARSSAPC